MHIVESMTDKDVYFIFREGNQEVKVDVRSGRIRSDNKLRPEERKYFYDEILMFDDLNDGIGKESEAINNLAEQGFSDHSIALRLDLKVDYVAKKTAKYWKDRMKNKNE